MVTYLVLKQKIGRTHNKRSMRRSRMLGLLYQPVLEHLALHTHEIRDASMTVPQRAGTMGLGHDLGAGETPAYQVKQTSSKQSH